jgi:phenylacetate-coenzyme A ligase PaaK-like adenylate-forming protein
MSMPRRLAVKTLLRLSSSQIPANLREFSRLEHLPRPQLKTYQQHKLEVLLLHAHAHVPYYRDLLSEHGVVSDGRVQLENFKKIPILTKNLLRKKTDDLTSNDHVKREAFFNSSGGSSGAPVRFVQDPMYRDFNFANKIYYKTFAGQQVGDPELRLWGSERDILGTSAPLAERLKMYLYNREELNAFDLSAKTYSDFVSLWNRFKPTWIESYAQSMFEFARMVTQQNTPMHRPRGILTSAGTLLPHMRETIENTFNCIVYNRYGSREVGDMACTCEQRKGLHLSVWNHFVEVLDSELKPSAPGELGRLYVTTLNNFSMPLIRYDIGDIAALAENDDYCACGRTTPLLKQVEGRETSIFRTQSGRLIPGEFFIHFVGVVFNKGGVGRFQVIQKTLSSLEIKVVVHNEHDFSKQKPVVEEVIRKTMGHDCSINWKEVDDIPPLTSGKYLYTVSEVEQNPETH